MAQVHPVLQRNRIPFETRLTSKRESLGFIVVTPVQQNAQDGQELTRELSEARELVDAESAARVDTESKVEQLTSELGQAEERLQFEADTRAAMEAEAKVKAEERAADLERTERAATVEASIRQQIEKNTRDRIQILSAKLAEAESQIQSESEKKAQPVPEEIETLKSELGLAAQKLESQSAVRIELEASTTSRLKSLSEELVQAEELAEKEVGIRHEVEAELKSRIASQSAELAEAKDRLETETEARIQSDAELQVQTRSLAEELAQERERADSAAEAKDRIGEQAKVQVEELAGQIESLKQQALEGASDNHQREQDAQARIEALTTQLAQAETKIAEENQQYVEHDGEVHAEVAQAKEQIASLGNELAEIKEELAKQADALVNDLAKAMRQVQMQERLRVQAEELAEEKTNALASALIDLEKHSQANDSAQQQVKELRRQLAESKRLASLASDQTDPDPEPDPEPTEPGFQPLLNDVADVPAELREPIRSSETTGNPVMRSMLERFVTNLNQQLITIEAAHERQDYAEVASSCRLLKGVVHSMGFKDLVDPVNQLDNLLRDKQYGHLSAKIDELSQYALRIMMDDDANIEPSAGSEPVVGEKAEQPGREPILFKVPADNQRKEELSENFIFKLGTEILEMESAWRKEDYSELKRLCRWAVKYAKTLDFHEVVQAATELEQAVARVDRSDMAAKIESLGSLYCRIELVQE
ncbi:MAG: hypothetical protein QGG98_04120 [Pseudomonadales bacterium]|nr:hypothetical protein [Pseudomonadales bacterium]